MEWFKVTIHVGDPIGNLPERLVELVAIVITGTESIIWESGIAGAPGVSEGTRVEVIVDHPLRVQEILSMVDDWLEETGTTRALAEVSKTLAFQIE